MEHITRRLSGFSPRQINTAYVNTFQTIAQSLTFRGERVVHVHFGYVPSLLDAAIPPEFREDIAPVRLTVFTRNGGQASFQINASIAGHLFDCFQAQVGHAPLTLSHDATMEPKFTRFC